MQAAGRLSYFLLPVLGRYDQGNLGKEEFDIQFRRVSDQNGRVEAAGGPGSRSRMLRAHILNLEHKAKSSLQGELSVNPSKLTPRTHLQQQDHTLSSLKQHHQLATKCFNAYGDVLVQT